MSLVIADKKSCRLQRVHLLAT